MNIKYVSSLSLFCVVSSYTTEKNLAPKQDFNREESVFKKIDPAFSERIERTKKGLNDCRKSFMGYGDCASQAMDYQNAKNDLLKKSRTKAEKNQIKYNEVRSECAWWNLICFSDNVSPVITDHVRHRSISVVMESETFDNDFLTSDQSFEEFVDNKCKTLDVLKDKLVPQKKALD